MRYTIACSLLTFTGLAGCVTKRDLRDAGAELHRSVISTLSKHEKAREHPYSAWGKVVEITEDNAPPLNNAGWVTVVHYRIAVIPDRDPHAAANGASSNCIVYSQGFRQSEEVTRAFKVGERVCLTGNVIKYPWEWAREGRTAADRIRFQGKRPEADK